MGYSQNPFVARCAGETIARGIEAGPRERIFIELMTSDRKLKASREGSKWRNYGTSKPSGELDLTPKLTGAYHSPWLPTFPWSGIATDAGLDPKP